MSRAPGRVLNPSMRYWLNRTGQAEGPYERDQILAWRNGGTLAGANVCGEGEQSWQSVAEHPAFAVAAAPAPASAPEGDGAPAPSPSPAALGMGPGLTSSNPGSPAGALSSVASASDPLSPGTLPAKKKSPLLVVPVGVILLMVAAFGVYAFVHHRGVAADAQHSVDFMSGNMERGVTSRYYQTREDYARAIADHEERREEHQASSWTWCAGGSFAFLLGLAAFGFVGFRWRSNKPHNDEVDRLAAARREAGLDPFTGEPKKPTAPSAAVAQSGEEWRPSSDLDRFVYETARSTVESDETVRGAGLLWRDAPVFYIVLQFIGLLAGLLPAIPLTLLRSAKQRLWYAVPTDRRLLLIETEKGAFGGKPKLVQKGTAFIPYAELASAEQSGTKLTFVYRDGRREAFRLSSVSAGLTDHGRFKSGFAGWLRQRLADGAA